MLNNILKVYGEDLANGDLAEASISGNTAIVAGSTMGALCVNVFAKGDVNIVDEVKISVKDGETQDGGFAEILNISIEAGNYADGSLMATATLPVDVRSYVIADVTSSTANSGGVRVTLGYLAR